MAHTEPRSTPLREGSIAIVTGAIYGTVHTLSGHPLDNVKARLQLDTSYHSLSTASAVRRMYRTEGLQAFFRGCLPPLWGSAVYRSIMMSS
jgi:solute carrier family 25 carnitine/acylcarnitine transporter 20/29